MSPVETEYVDCPLCGDVQQTVLREKNGWKIVRCASCGLARVNPRRKHASDLYRNDAYFEDEKYYYDYKGNKDAYQKGFRSKLRLLSQHCARKGKLLDVGAAYGFFMEEASRFGFEPCGVELSKAAVIHAAKYGEVFHGSLSDAEFDQRFSVVTFIDSLEHFENPMDGLNKAWQLLEKGGVVAVMVPNIDSLFSRITRSKWHLLLPEEHLFYFSPGSTRAMLEAANFELVHMGTGGYGRSLAEIFHVIFRGINLPINSLENALMKVTFEINLGDIFAIARKRDGFAAD